MADAPREPLMSPHAKVGLFTLIAIGILFWATFQLGDFRVGFGADQSYWARIDDAHGLGRDTPVEVSGIRVGRVTAVGIAPDGEKARLDLELRDDVPVYRDAALHVKTSGLLGDRYLGLDQGTPGAGPLPPGSEIPRTRAPRSMAQVMDEISPVAENLRVITADLRKLTGDEGLQGDVRETFAAIRRTADRLDRVTRSQEQSLEQLIHHLARAAESLDHELPATLRSARQTFQSTETMVTSMRDPITRAVDRVDRVSRTIDTAARDLQEILAGVRDGEGTVGALVSDEETGRRVKDAVATISDTLESIEEMRTEVSYLGTYQLPGHGGEGGGIRHHTQLKVQPDYDHYYSFSLVKRPELATSRVRRTTEHLDADGNVTRTTRKRVITTENRFLFDVQMAKRFWDLTLRLGLIESTGGFGLDYALFDDHLWLRSEVFDFGRLSTADDNPYLRTWAELRLFKHLTVAVGVEDVAGRVAGPRFRAGAGLQFDDEDLKLLFSALPSVSF